MILGRYIRYMVAPEKGRAMAVVPNWIIVHPSLRLLTDKKLTAEKIIMKMWGVSHVCGFSIVSLQEKALFVRPYRGGGGAKGFGFL